MNVNVSSVSESSKAVKSGGGSVEVAKESEQGNGFFSKLTDLISGKSSSDAAESKVDTEVKGSDTKAATADESVDSLLDESENSEKVAGSKGESEPKLSVDEESDANASKIKDSAQDTEQKFDSTMSEGDELLSRLNESNNTLQSKDGKPLPQDDSTDVSDEKNKPALGAAAASAAQNNGEVKSSASSVNKNSVTQTVPESLKPFVENNVTTENNSETNNLKGAAVVASGSTAEVALEQRGVAQGAETSNLKTASNTQHVETPAGSDTEAQMKASLVAGSAAGTSTLSADDATVSEVTSKNAALPSAQTAGSQIEGSETASGATSRQAGITAAGISTTNELSADDEASTADAASLAAAPAIAWSSTAPTEAKMAIDSAELAGTTKASQGAQSTAALQSQQLHSQQVSHQAAMAAAAGVTDKAATPMPTDLSQIQMQQMATAHATPQVAGASAANSQAALKAALGASSVAGLSDSNKQGDGKDSHLAAQLSAAAGQQGVNNANPIRPEQVQQAQPPMQLTKELASDQVSERIQMMMSKNLKNIDIRLDPPELGRMQIRMNMNGDGAAVHFTVNNQQARDVIEQSMPRLREMLAQQGVQLGDTSVQQQSSGQQQGYASTNDHSNGQGGSTQHGLDEENLETDVKLDLNVTSKRDGISYYA